MTQIDKDNRIAIRLPNVLIAEVDRLIKDCPMFGNRQQFVETAIRERLIEARRDEVILRNAKQPHP